MARPKDPQTEYQQNYLLTYDHPALTADTTIKIDKVPAGKRLRIDSVQYVNPTGLAADNTNAFAGYLKNGSTVVATLFNTDGNDTPAGAAVDADTWVTATLSTTDTELIYAAGDTLSLLFDEDGTQTLPAGRVVIRGRYV